jgi:OmcA/MtrC family decaheme c-type cytochrome
MISLRRVPSGLGRAAAALAVLAGAALLIGKSDRPVFTASDKAYYADAALVQFVRPGLVLKITTADIAADGTIRVRFTLTDPKGLPLDKDGVTTPGPVTLSFIAATIPNGQSEYTAYTTSVRTLKAPDGTGVSRTLPGTDSGGTYETLGDGDYRYTFRTRAPLGYDRTATHTIGVTARRDLTEFDLDRQYANDVYTFRPDGGQVTTVRDIVRTETCNQRCHDPLAAHGSNRRDIRLCVLCHQSQNVDAVGTSLALPVLVHKIHMGSELPSVQAGQTAQWYLSSPVDFSDVEFPAGIRNCTVCHDPNSGAAQANNWLTKPSRAACGACHDNVKFATGEGHNGLVEVSDRECANCHYPEGELPFDASIKGAHLDPQFSPDLPGTVFEILSVTNAAPGQPPTVTFSIKDKAGKPILPSEMTRCSLVLGGPTSDYTTAVSEDVRKAQGGNGIYTWTFTNTIPADAKGSYSVGIEGYRNINLLPGTTQQVTVRDAGDNKVFYFSVDGSPVSPRRQVVSIDKCNACHLKLSMHGSQRNQIQQCVQCHNNKKTDSAGTAIAFKLMIHRIHTGEDLQIPYTIGKTDMTKIVFPGDRRDCAKCHVNNSEQLPLPAGLLPVDTPNEPYTPLGPVSAACLGCHTDTAVYAHAYSMTTTIGESCASCHGANEDASVSRVHAR